MIQFETKKPRLSINFKNPNEIEITFTTTKNQAPEIEALKEDKIYSVIVKESHKHRTLTQNAYLWVLLDEIGKNIGESKDFVYRDYIKNYGVFQIIPMKEEAIESFIFKWEKNGMGWFCEILGDAKLNGYKNVVAYFGSSTYNTKEMGRVIDAVIYDCEKMGINSMSKNDFLSLENYNDV